MLAGACPVDDGGIVYKKGELYAERRQTAQIKKKIGYAPSAQIYDADMSAIEIIDLLGRAKGVDPDKRVRQIREAFELTGLGSKTDVLYGEMTLSERRRLAIACALIGGPDVIILDEPLRYLDPKQVSEVKKLIRMLGTKKVVLLFSAYPAEIEDLSDNVAILCDGELALWEETDSLMSRLKANGVGGLAKVLDALCEESAKKSNDGEER